MAVCSKINRRLQSSRTARFMAMGASIATAVAATLPAAWAVTDLECSATTERPDLPAHIDIRKVRVSLDGETAKVTLQLRDLASPVSYDSQTPYDANDWEYVWGLAVDTDANPANDVVYDAFGNPAAPDYGRRIGDQLLVATHTPSGGTAKSALVANMPLAPATWKATPEANKAGQLDFNVITGTASLFIDTAAREITVSGRLPGVTPSSRFYAVAAEDKDMASAGGNAVFEPCVPTAAPLTGPSSGQEGFSVQAGIIPAANAVVSSSGPLNARSLSVDLTLADLTPSAANGFLAGTYNVYVAALVPAGTVVPTPAWFAKHPAPRWEPLAAGVPLSAFMQNVQASSQDARVRISVLQDQDLGGLIGTEFYIGYGTSDTEMLQNRRYRGIYKVGPQ